MIQLAILVVVTGKAHCHLILRGMEAKRRAEETRVALASFSARVVP